MYALLQLVSLIMLYLFLKLLRAPGSRGLIIGFIATFWFGVFTHIAICLFLPPMLALAVWKQRSALWGRRLDLSIALAGACAAPVALLGLNRLVTPQQSNPGRDWLRRIRRRLPAVGRARSAPAASRAGDCCSATTNRAGSSRT